MFNDYSDLFLGFLVSKLVSNLILYKHWDKAFLTWFLTYFILSGVAIITIRLTLRWVYNFLQEKKIRQSKEKSAGKIKVMIIGAGEAGRMIMSELARKQISLYTQSSSYY
ncbi:MAG: nucleoside-diphosphate sugar epimerase/dehydratase [Acutalibacteraceae bacterium]